MTGCATCRCVKPGMIVAACRSARSISDVRKRRRRSAARSISPRSHSRRSVATWSLRERPVCRRLPASPTSAVRRFSMLRCTSSSPTDHGEAAGVDLGADLAHAALDRVEVVAGDHADAASMRACASEPSMSASARRRSKPTEAWKRATRSDIGSAKRPDQAPRRRRVAASGARRGGRAGVGHRRGRSWSGLRLRAPRRLPTIAVTGSGRAPPRRWDARGYRRGVRGGHDACMATEMASIIRHSPRAHVPALPGPAATSGRSCGSCSP